MRDDPPMIQVGIYPTRSDAELAQTALTAAGIESVLAADDAGGAYPFALSGGARLLVDESDADNAAAVLSERPPPQRRSAERLMSRGARRFDSGVVLLTYLPAS